MPESNDTPDGWAEAAAAKQSEALQGLRLQIDAVDRELLALLNRRASLSLEVGRVKANTSGPVFRPQRERQILDNLARENAGPLPEEHLRSIWHEIFASSRSLQRPVSVAYLGPEGTNSYFAAVDLLGNLMDYRPCKNFRETMGIKEQLIFPEIEYDKVDKLRGMDIIFVTTANSDEEAKELLKLMGMPFKN